MTMIRFSIIFLGLVALNANANTPVSLPVPGGVVVIALAKKSDQPPRATYNKKRVSVVCNDSTWQAVVGIPLSAKPGRHNIKVSWPDKTTSTYNFQVENKEYETRHITIKNKRKVTPLQEDMARIKKERSIKANARKTWTDSAARFDFIRPVEGPLSSPFGLQRIYNNQERIRRHTGLDFAAPEGTPIVAPADGVVVVAHDFFFSGNMVYLDHGNGFITSYAHLSRIDVKPGQKLQQGDQLGAVGMTGRVTGPHLHWTVFLNQTSVDPSLFIADQLVTRP